jgi:hypothetical protein
MKLQLLLTIISPPFHYYLVGGSSRSCCTLIKGTNMCPLFCYASLFRFSPTNFTFSYLTLFSKFYFNFPSQYLFAIGLAAIFSIRCHLPPIINFIQQSQAVLLLSSQSIKIKHNYQLRGFHSLGRCFPTDLLILYSTFFNHP